MRWNVLQSRRYNFLQNGTCIQPFLTVRKVLSSRLKIDDKSSAMLRSKNAGFYKKLLRAIVSSSRHGQIEMLLQVLHFVDTHESKKM